MPVLRIFSVLLNAILKQNKEMQALTRQLNVQASFQIALPIDDEIVFLRVCVFLNDNGHIKNATMAFENGLSSKVFQNLQLVAAAQPSLQ